MANFIKLIQATDETSVWVNADRIRTFQPFDNGSVIRFECGATLCVKEEPERIIRIMRTGLSR